MSTAVPREPGARQVQEALVHGSLGRFLRQPRDSSACTLIWNLMSLTVALGGIIVVTKTPNKSVAGTTAQRLTSATARRPTMVLSARTGPSTNRYESQVGT